VQAGLNSSKVALVKERISKKGNLRKYWKGKCVMGQGNSGAILTAANPTTAEKNGLGLDHLP